MIRVRLLLGVAALGLAAAACSAEVVQPQTRGLEESNSAVFTRFSSGTARADRTATGLLVTVDGRRWEEPTGDDADLGRVAVALQQPGQLEECGPDGTCYRLSSPAGGIRVEESIDSAASWRTVWETSAGRIDFQDRCCGSRPFVLDDLEYVPDTGVVAVSLGRYGLLTRDVDGQWRLDTLGRPDRPTSGFMVGLYVEPLVVAVLAVVVGWATAEIRLGRLRRHMMDQQPTDHEWITGRARLPPILLPVLFLATIGIVAALVLRLSQTVESDPAPARGWWAVTAAFVLVLATAAVGHRLLARQWEARDSVKDEAFFAAARAVAFKASAMGNSASLLATGVALVPLIAWTTGVIDRYGDATLASGLALLGLTAVFWVWSGTASMARRDPPLREGRTPMLETVVDYRADDEGGGR